MSVTRLRQITYPCPDCGGGPERHRRTPRGFECMVEAIVDDDGCYESGRTHEPGLHHPTCNAIRNGGRCDVGRGWDDVP